VDGHLILSGFIALAAAHFVADIPLNPAWLGRAKRKSRGAKRVWFLAGHCCIVAVVSYVFLLGWRSAALLFMAVAAGACHFLVDCARLWIEPRVYRDPPRRGGDWWRVNRRRWWLVNIGDQAAHLACIAAIVWLSSPRT
jgi:hypothetical protein